MNQSPRLHISPSSQHPDQSDPDRSAESSSCATDPANDTGPESSDRDLATRRSRARLWGIVGSAAVVVLAALLITGLAAPGWMLGSDSSAQATVQRYNTAYNARDVDGMIALMCQQALGQQPDEQQKQALQQQLSALGLHAEMAGTVNEQGLTAQGTVEVNGAVNGQTASYKVSVPLKKVNGHWCIDK